MRFTLHSEVKGLDQPVQRNAANISKALAFSMQASCAKDACDFVNGKEMLFGCGMAVCDLEKKMEDIFLKIETSYIMEMKLCE